MNIGTLSAIFDKQLWVNMGGIPLLGFSLNNSETVEVETLETFMPNIVSLTHSPLAHTSLQILDNTRTRVYTNYININIIYIHIRLYKIYYYIILLYTNRSPPPLPCFALKENNCETGIILKVF